MKNKKYYRRILYLHKKNLKNNFIKSFPVFGWPILSLIFVIFFWLWNASFIPTPYSFSLDRYGLYGDSFGKLTSLFTALGFGGLIVTLLLQQRQIRSQEQESNKSRIKEEKGRYEEILFRLIEIYRQNILEVKVGDLQGRDVLRKALERVDTALVEEKVHDLPGYLRGRRDNASLTKTDFQQIEYYYFRNFKIVSTEIQPQARLIDTLEVLLGHMVDGAPEKMLINTYKDLVWAQLTFLECRYFFLVALSYPSRSRLRMLLEKSGFFDRLSRSQVYYLHREMYEKYWGYTIIHREVPQSIPIDDKAIGVAMAAHRSAGELPISKYTAFGVRQSKK